MLRAQQAGKRQNSWLGVRGLLDAMPGLLVPQGHHSAHRSTTDSTPGVPCCSCSGLSCLYAGHLITEKAAARL